MASGANGHMYTCFSKQEAQRALHLKQIQYIASKAASSPSTKRVHQQEALQGITCLNWHPDAVQQPIMILGAIQVVPMCPVIA